MSVGMAPHINTVIFILMIFGNIYVCISKVEGCETIKTTVQKQFDFDLQDCIVECCTTDNCTTPLAATHRRDSRHDNPSRVAVTVLLLGLLYSL